MRERPDYVKNFQKPKNTEIKYINGHWYLYEKYGVYDPISKKMRKKSGQIIGKVTPGGLKKSVHRKKKEDPTVIPHPEVQTETPGSDGEIQPVKRGEGQHRGEMGDLIMNPTVEIFYPSSERILA